MPLSLALAVTTHCVRSPRDRRNAGIDRAARLLPCRLPVPETPGPQELSHPPGKLWDVALPDRERLKLWVRAGGICAICKLYLLESGLTGREVTRGELAHVVGQKNAAKSPRGLNPLPEDERDTADNAVLLCPTCHTEIDDRGQLDLFEVEKLFDLKHKHEAFIRDVTGRPESQRTVVLRLRGSVRGTPDDLSRDAATKAILASTDRFPSFPFADRFGVEIDLTGLAGETEADRAYYDAAVRKIDETIERSLKPAAADDMVPHLSVLAIGRLPLLVYLGSRLDDTIATDVYQRHRASETWTWPPDAQQVEFRWRLDHDSPGGQAEGVVIVNASGTIHPSELPAEIGDLPRFVVDPVDAVPQPDTVSTRETLRSFEQAVRALLAQLEASHKSLRRLHVFVAAPVSVAVTLGRAAGWGIHPSFAVYDRAEGQYQLALEVTAP